MSHGWYNARSTVWASAASRVGADCTVTRGTGMSDATTGQPVRVSTDGTGGPYIMVPTDQVDRVRKILEDHRVAHWVDHVAISVDGRPAVAVINLGRRADPRQVQSLLDAAA